MALEVKSGAGEIEERAPAKINLALHVTGRREDGYHLLDSVVTFAEDGDEILLSSAEEDQFILTGRFGPELSADAEGRDGNLVLKARNLLREALDELGQPHAPVAITLEKNLPVASGIGGGSADAAATLRGLKRLWQADLPAGRLEKIALALGADVPMCLRSRPLRARGIGEDLAPLSLPSFPMVLVNPLKAVSTPEIFHRLTRRDNPPVGALPADGDAGSWLNMLHGLRNDLEPPAAEIVPEVAEIIGLLGESQAVLARMSGSGATCFGLYADEAAAFKAALALSAYRPNWYVLLTRSVTGEPR